MEPEPTHLLDANGHGSCLNAGCSEQLDFTLSEGNRSGAGTPDVTSWKEWKICPACGAAHSRVTTTFEYRLFVDPPRQ